MGESAMIPNAHRGNNERIESRTIFYGLLTLAALLVLALGVSAATAESVDGEVQYTVTFNPNQGVVTREYGGDTETLSYYAKTSNASESIYIPGNSFTVGMAVDDQSSEVAGIYEYVRNGYTFLGWSKDKDATVPDYYEGYILEITGPLTLYAVWSGNLYDVTFKIGTTDMIYQVRYGSNMDTNHMMNMVPAGMEDYVIVGWSTDQPTKVNGERYNGKDVYGIVNANNLFSMKVALKSPADLTLYPIYALKCEFRVNSSHTLNDAEGCYYLTLASGISSCTSGGLTISNGSPYLFIDGLRMDFSGADRSPFVIKTTANTGTDGAVANVVILSDSEFSGGHKNIVVDRNTYNLGYAGINVQPHTTLNIVETSVGKLTAKGGDVKTTGSSNWMQVTVTSIGKSGPGIGSNWKDDLTDGGCGKINVYGGTVVASGGKSDVDAYRNIWAGFVTTPVSEDFVAAQGMGGAGADINLYAGNVTATTGKIEANLNGNFTVLDDRFINDCEPFEPSSEPYIENATVTAVGRTGGQIIAEEQATLSFTVDGRSNVTITGVVILTIGDIEIEMGGGAISPDTELKLPKDLIKVGYTVSITTQIGNYLVGDVEGDDDTSVYTVDLKTKSDTPHGSVSVYVNKTKVSEAVEYYGSVAPYQDFNASEESSFTFIVNLYETYALEDVLCRENGQWVSLNINIADYRDSLNKDLYRIPVPLTLATGENSPHNDISFMITKKKVDVGLTIEYHGTLSQGVIIAEVSDPGAVEWTSEYKSGTQRIYYGDTRTYIVDTRTNGNPLFLQQISVDGELLDYVDNANGTYSFTLDNVRDSKLVAVSFNDTVKVTLKQFWVDGTLICESLFTNPDGTVRDIGVIPDSPINPSYYYTFIEKGTNIYFSMRLINGNDGDGSGVHYGLKCIQMSYGSGSEKILNYQTGGFYKDLSIQSDLLITPDVTALIHDIYLKSTIGGDEHTYHFKVPDGTQLSAPSDDELYSLTADDAGVTGSEIVFRGHELLKWKWGSVDVSVGGTIDVTAKGGVTHLDIILIAEWNVDECIVYTITYNLDGGENAPNNPSTYTVEDEVTISNPKKRGYTFMGWDGDPRTSFSNEIGNKTYTAIWKILDNIIVTLVDDTFDGHNIVVIDDPVRTYTYGDRYSNLPIYENQKVGDAMYIFAGWALKNGTRITVTSTVNLEEDHDLRIVWVKIGGHIINVENGADLLGKLSAPSSCAQGDEIEITVVPAAGYYIDKLVIKGVSGTITEFAPVSSYDTLTGESTYTGKSSKTIDSGSPTEVDGMPVESTVDGVKVYVFKYKPDQNITVSVVFAAMEFTLTVYEARLVDGKLEYISHEQKFTVASQSIYVNGSYGIIGGYEFKGWADSVSGEVIIDISNTGKIAVLRGSIGDKTYWERWSLTTYLITYVLNGGTIVSPPDKYTIGQEITLIDASRDSHNFKGWYDNPEFTGNQYTVFVADAAGGLTFYAKWIFAVAIPIPTDYIYDGDPHDGVPVSAWYTVSDNNTKTDVGKYPITLTLTGDCEWADKTATIKEFAWKITPRPVIIIADSNLWTHDGTAHTDSGFTVIGGLPSDVWSVTVSGTITNEGSVRNRIDDYSCTSPHYSNYEFHIYDGVLTVVGSGSSSVIIEGSGEAPARPAASPHSMSLNMNAIRTVPEVAAVVQPSRPLSRFDLS